jgi:hypothetical protein
MGAVGSATASAGGAAGGNGGCVDTGSGATGRIRGPAGTGPGDTPTGAPHDRQNFFPGGTSVPHVAQRTTVGASFGRLVAALGEPSWAALGGATGGDGFASTGTSGEPQFRQKAFAAACSVPQEGHTLRATTATAASAPSRPEKGATSEA